MKIKKKSDPLHPAFNIVNYINIHLPFFNQLPPATSMWTFFTLKVDTHGHFLDLVPTLFVHVVIEWPQVLTYNIWMVPRELMHFFMFMVKKLIWRPFYWVLNFQYLRSISSAFLILHFIIWWKKLWSPNSNMMRLFSKLLKNTAFSL